MVETAFNDVSSKWEKFLNQIKIDTPDDDANTFINYWNPYQAKVAFDIGRVASFYYWGLGRGFGFRDVPSDRLGLGIMRERAEAIGADLSIDTQPGQGTVVRVVWVAGEQHVQGEIDDAIIEGPAGNRRTLPG